jgi:ribosomal protein RSM22 (predicted rRNA methylase)
MELPAALRQAVDEVLAPFPPGRLAAAARTLSERYRGEVRDGALHIADDVAACAYLATRLPATFAALASALNAVADMRPDFAPATMLDIGAGPGTAMWAAAQVWPLADALLLERSPAIRRIGARLSGAAALARVDWREADLSRGINAAVQEKRDLVVIAYVLNELAPEARDRLIAESWAATGDMLVVVEPGTPAGWQRILRAREKLIEQGAHPVAPCPHALACPLAPPDWCHFSRKVARTRLHRLIKDADVPWEDEKFAYVAASRQPAQEVEGRVIGPPRGASGQIGLKLCARDGTWAERRFTRRDGAAYRIARRLGWGDTLPRA